MRVFLDLHRRLDELLSEAGLGPADVTTHDFARREVQVIWEDRKLMLIIDEVGAEVVAS